MSIDALIEHLRHGRTEDRIAAARALGDARDPQAVPHLAWLVEQGSEWEAMNAIDALAAIGHETALPALALALRAEARKIAIDQLAQSPDRRQELSHRAGVSEQRYNDLRDLRAAAARALGALRHPDAVVCLGEALADPHHTTPRRACTNALRRIGTPGALETLERWMQARTAARRTDV